MNSAAIPRLLPPDQETRRGAFIVLCHVLNARGDVTGEAADRLRQVAQLFGVEGRSECRARGEGRSQGQSMMSDSQSNIIALINRAKQVSAVRGAVVHPCDESSLTGVVQAAQNGLLNAVLVGPAQRIKAVAREHDLDIGSFELVDAPHSEAAAAKAVQLVHEGKAELLMKGSLHTDELMRSVTASATGLRTARRISHVFIMDVPTYPETLFIADAAINIAPDLDAKRNIVQIPIDLFVELGLGTPRVANPFRQVETSR